MQIDSLPSVKLRYTFDSVLSYQTPAQWSESALKDLPSLMSDHAWSERKASGTCLSLLASHLEFPQMAEPMIRLAREELEHFQLVFNLMSERGFKLLVDKSNLYVTAMRQEVRTGEFQLQDRLLISGLIEARSCERLGLISEAIEDLQLKDFYARLQKAEARHFSEFIELAESIYGNESTHARLHQLRALEAKSIQAVGFTARIH